jgi:hypothetical protein
MLLISSCCSGAAEGCTCIENSSRGEVEAVTQCNITEQDSALPGHNGSFAKRRMPREAESRRQVACCHPPHPGHMSVSKVMGTNGIHPDVALGHQRGMLQGSIRCNSIYGMTKLIVFESAFHYPINSFCQHHSQSLDTAFKRPSNQK